MQAAPSSDSQCSDPVGSYPLGSYPLGDGDQEQRRLILQSRFVDVLTRDVFAHAGLREGMRVLDVGCGVGDVSLLARTFVGESGSVLGIDRSAESIAVARRRAQSSGARNVEFAQASLEELTSTEPFDALVGRLILLYLPEPAQALRKLLGLLRPGGLVVFQEMDMLSARAVPACTLYARVGAWLCTTFERAGVDVEMGSHLYSTFLHAGLPTPQLLSAAHVGGGESTELFEWLTSTLRSLLPLMEKFGIATPAELQLDSLASRLCAEVSAGGGVVHTPCYVGGWARKPLA
jgi:2-polyprenyl-3-methyl-5-hydroxy-6-metoxy-1,4-benzoquinol methylase